MSITDHFRKNFFLAFPVMLSQLGHVLVGVADTVMVGKLGALSLAAASLANAVFFLLFTFGIGVSYAITPLVAEADGAGNKSYISTILKHGFLINLVTGIFLFILVLFGNGILHEMEQPADVVTLALPYLGIITFSIIPFMLFQTFRQFAEGLSMTKQAMYITLSANVVNIILNYIFIYGKLGIEPMGLMGAGWATLVSRVLMATMMFVFIYKNKTTSQFRAGLGIGQYSFKMVSKMLRIGIPAAFQFTFEVSAFGGAAVMIGWLGTNSLAAHQIAINLVSVSYMMASGLAASATIRVGNQLGKRDIRTMRKAAFTIFGMVIAFMFACGLVFFLGRHHFPTYYIDNEQVLELASTLIIVASLFQLSDGVQVVGLGALRGLKDVKIPTLYTFIAYWILGLPVGYLLGFRLGYGAVGVWVGLLIGLTVVAFMLSVRFHRLTKKMLN